MPHPCAVVSLYRSQRNPPRGVNAASAQAASPAGDMSSKTGISRKVLTLGASGGLMSVDVRAAGQWVEGNVMAARSCEWNNATLTKRKMRMGRIMRTRGDWEMDGFIV